MESSRGEAPPPPQLLQPISNRSVTCRNSFLIKGNGFQLVNSPENFRLVLLRRPTFHGWHRSAHHDLPMLNSRDHFRRSVLLQQSEGRLTQFDSLAESNWQRNRQSNAGLKA